MEENGDKKVNVELVPARGNPGAAVCFIFAMLCYLFWANILGMLGPGAQIVLGCIQLGAFGAYHICSQDFLEIGDGFDGNAFMVFAAVFAGIGGLMNVVQAVCLNVGMPFSNVPGSFVWLISGLLLLLLIPAVKATPKVNFLFYVFGGAALTIMGLVGLGLIPAGIMPFVAWLLFIVGTLGMISALATFYSFMGKEIPLGKPFFK
jgi:hypothetical protein